MGSRSMTVGRYEEIRRRLGEGRGLREIARALGCSRCTVREVRDYALYTNMLSPRRRRRVACDGAARLSQHSYWGAERHSASQ